MSSLESTLVEPQLPFANRTEAARILARQLAHYQGREDVFVLALPRGGVPVGYEISRALEAPFDLMLVRKLGCPGQEELAVGAIAAGGVRVLNPEVAQWVDEKALSAIEAREWREIERRQRLYRENRPLPNLKDRIVILADDGLATGATMKAAIHAVQVQQPARVVVAVPVGPIETIRSLRSEADEVICSATPDPFFAIGLWYRDFRQVTDDQVRDTLSKSWRGMPAETASTTEERSLRSQDTSEQEKVR